MKNTWMVLLASLLLVLTACGGDSQSGAAGQVGPNGGGVIAGDSARNDENGSGTSGAMPEDPLVNGAGDAMGGTGSGSTAGDLPGAGSDAGSASGRTMGEY